MNHIYRLVCNATGRCTPAAEGSRGKGKSVHGKSGCGRRVLRLIAGAGLAGAAAGAMALPSGNQTVSGQGSVSTAGNSMTVNQQSANLTLNWQSFNIAGGETVRFVQPSSSSIALNRVIGNDPSQIYGSLQANGQVFLINPNGILFGRGAQVDVGGLVASTLSLSDADFSAGKYKFAGAAGTPATVVNQGTLTAATGGYIALLGGQVSNQGTITARLGSVSLAAGQAVTLDFTGNKLMQVTVDQGALGALAENRQLIQADGGTVLMTAAARDAVLDTVVNNSGIIEARALDNQGGTIRLLGGMHGGTVQVGGTLDTSASGGGNGGFIETSGYHVAVLPGAVVNTGRRGQWLIDPTNINIDTAAASTIVGTLNGGGGVTEDTASGGSDAGDITVSSAIVWTGTGVLTLRASHDININAQIQGDSGGLTLGAANNITASAPVGVGSFILQLGNWSQVGAGLPAFAAGDFQIQGGTFLRAAGGDGSAGNPYMLTDIYGVQGMGTFLGNNFGLAGDIDAAVTGGWNAGTGFSPIGNTSTPFTGSLNGNGHAITGLTINRPSANYIGLISDLGGGGTVSDLGLVGGSITGSFATGALVGYNSGTVADAYASAHVSGSDYTGGLVGWNDASGTVSNAHATGSVTGGTTNTGGLVGYNAGAVGNAYATGTVSGGFGVGGLVGKNDSGGSVSGSHAAGAVTGANDNVGGLVGENEGSVDTVYATGAVRGANYVGGLVGINYGGAVGNAHAAGAVSGTDYIGGLVGYNYMASVTRSYATGAVTGTNYTGGLLGISATGTVDTVYASGAVNGGSATGGLVGESFLGGTLSNAYATGSVSGGSNTGGLVGVNSQTAITNTYASGAVHGGANTGGLLGNNTGVIVSSYWDMQGTGQSIGIASGSIRIGATGLSGATALTQASYGGFDFNNTWWIVEGLSWPQLCALSTSCHSSSFLNTAAYAGALNYAYGSYGAAPGATLVAGYAGAGNGSINAGNDNGLGQPGSGAQAGNSRPGILNLGIKLPAGLSADN